MTVLAYNSAMQLGLISDIHGNLHALKACLAALEGLGVTTVLCAGDLVAYGAQPSGVIRLLRERSVPCVTGNYDYAVAFDQPNASRKPSSPRHEPVKQAALEWTKAALSVSEKRFLASLPWRQDFLIDGLHVTTMHAGIEYLDAWYVPEMPEAMFTLADRIQSDVIVMGHTHRAFQHRARSTLMVNPGAVGRSLDEDPRAAFAVLDTATLEVRQHRVNYDLRGAVRMIERSGMPPEIALLVKHGARRVEDLDRLERHAVPEPALEARAATLAV